MIIECKCCSRKFNLNGNLLKPAGSRVRCSKCGAIFHAYSAPSLSRLNPVLEADSIAKNADQVEGATTGVEKRKHPRVPVSIPALCDVLDLEGNSQDLYIGTIKDVSQTGLAIELFSAPSSAQVSLSLINLEKRDVQIKAKVVHSRTEDSFKTRVGFSLAGSAVEIDHFVSQVMRNHHLTDSADRQAQILETPKEGYPLTP
jgi:predicted Zn finger-like uncharacterized protein